MGRLTDKTALITGGTTGIGIATAKLFLQEGARVAITGQDAGRMESAKDELGPQVLAFLADVSKKEEMAEVGRALTASFGTLDILFANAGVAHMGPVEQLGEDSIDRQVGVNIKGVIFSIQAVLPILANPSSVVLTGSTVDSMGAAGMVLYAATKAAVRSLARGLSAELVGRGIRVNVVSPGPIETPIWNKAGLPNEAVQSLVANINASNPMKRFGRPEEVARAVLFLASGDSSYILGESLKVDGGAGTI